MLSGLRFLWTAGRGHRFRPWRSPYWRWRIETFSGAQAEEIRARDFWRFAWRERRSWCRFLAWTGEMRRHRRHGGHLGQSAQAGPADS
ncbi:MAG TPA: hypothetical protein VN690_02140 [Terriglobales bacterium]|nr:hypothetical protein [Terriglobales bacterium]